MNFLYSMEQRLLKDTVQEALLSITNDKAPEILAGLEVFSLMVSEDRGGSGLGLVEAAIVAEAAAKTGLSLPLSATILLADPLAQLRPDVAEMIFKGEALVDMATAGTLTLEAGRLRGRLTAKNLNTIHWLAAHVSNGEVALLDADKLSGAALQPVELGETAVSLDIDVGSDEAFLVRVLDHRDQLSVMYCAELLGAATHVFDLSMAYLKDRKQFGQPIGTNQALKHIAADTFMTLENVRVAVEYAAAALDAVRNSPHDEALADQARDAVNVMLAYVPATTREIAETAVQLHGGIGLTWEYELNGYLRRIIRLGMTLGQGSEQRLALFKGLLPGSEAKLKSMPGAEKTKRMIS
ncbi:acyl-CoA dehydrogenase family protein [Pontitalea aquivivens]|uniref:acyl-CoA dehydrogenase family protein n=1 Tax=Pontitalea aquivivens TaxID=3388663 RepID=UPI0039709FBF